MGSTQPSLLTLPNEILSSILEELDPKSLAQFSKTCRFFNDMVRNHSVWFLFFRKGMGPDLHQRIIRDLKTCPIPLSHLFHIASSWNCIECDNYTLNIHPLVPARLCFDCAVKHYPVVTKDTAASTFGLAEDDIAKLPYLSLEGAPDSAVVLLEHVEKRKNEKFALTMPEKVEFEKVLWSIGLVKRDGSGCAETSVCSECHGESETITVKTKGIILADKWLSHMEEDHKDLYEEFYGMEFEPDDFESDVGLEFGFDDAEYGGSDYYYEEDFPFGEFGFDDFENGDF